MDKYLEQLLADIAYATDNVSSPYPPSEKSPNIWDWISDEEEDKTAPRRMLEDWTGIRKAQLPPDGQITDGQIHLLFDALKKMLDAYNWMFVLQIQVPERI